MHSHTFSSFNVSIFFLVKDNRKIILLLRVNTRLHMPRNLVCLIQFIHRPFINQLWPISVATKRIDKETIIWWKPNSTESFTLKSALLYPNVIEELEVAGSHCKQWWIYKWIKCNYALFLKNNLDKQMEIIYGSILLIWLYPPNTYISWLITI